MSDSVSAIVSVSQVDWLQETWIKLVTSNSSLRDEVNEMKVLLAACKEEEHRLKVSLSSIQSELSTVSADLFSILPLT